MQMTESWLSEWSQQNQFYLQLLSAEENCQQYHISYGKLAPISLILSLSNITESHFSYHIVVEVNTHFNMPTSHIAFLLLSLKKQCKYFYANHQYQTEWELNRALCQIKLVEDYPINQTDLMIWQEAITDLITHIQESYLDLLKEEAYYCQESNHLPIATLMYQLWYQFTDHSNLSQTEAIVYTLLDLFRAQHKWQDSIDLLVDSTHITNDEQTIAQFYFAASMIAKNFLQDEEQTQHLLSKTLMVDPSHEDARQALNMDIQDHD